MSNFPHLIWFLYFHVHIKCYKEHFDARCTSTLCGCVCMCPLEKTCTAHAMGELFSHSLCSTVKRVQIILSPQAFLKMFKVDSAPSLLTYHPCCKTSYLQSIQNLALLVTLGYIYSNDLHIHCYSRRRYKTFDDMLFSVVVSIACHKWMNISGSRWNDSIIFFVAFSAILCCAKVLCGTRILMPYCNILLSSDASCCLFIFINLLFFSFCATNNYCWCFVVATLLRWCVDK